MGFEKFIAHQCHHAPNTAAITVDTADDPPVLDVLYDNPPLMALLHDAARHGDLTALRAAVLALDPVECDHVDPPLLVAELVVRMTMTRPPLGPNAQVVLVTALQNQGLCDREHFEYVLVAAALEHGANAGHLPADIYDTVADYVTRDGDPEFADCLNDIERRPTHDNQ